MARIFGDESADGKAQIVFAVAALVGSDDEWNAAVGEWLELTKGEDFHANSWESKHRGDSYKRLAQVIQSSGLRGYGVGIDLAAFRASIIDSTQDYAYFKCFIEVTDKLIQISAENDYKDLTFTFDGRPGQGTTGLLYDYISSQKEWTCSLSFADQISFKDRKNPCIQMADLVARETMKGFLCALKDENYREPFRVLASSQGRLKFDFLMGEYFSQWAAGLRDLEKVTGIYASEYFAWVKQKNMQENLSSRIRYLIWHDSKNRRLTPR
jgi:hypothetical protein